MKKVYLTGVMTLTTSRIIGAFSLLFITPLTLLFYVVYTYCIFSDIADGYVARKKKVCTNVGAFYDSAADVILIAILLVVLIPVLSLSTWIISLIALVIVVRLFALAIGFWKYNTFSMLHTYSNKAAGLVMACFPLFLGLFGLNIAFLIIFFAAFTSAFEEFIITIRAKKLDRNIISVFHVNDKNGN